MEEKQVQSDKAARDLRSRQLNEFDINYHMSRGKTEQEALAAVRALRLVKRK